MCNVTVQELEQKADKFEKHKFYSSKEGITKNISGDRELEIYNGDTTTKKDLMELVFHSIKEYVYHLNFPWFNGWHGYTDIKWNKYTNNNLMAEHCDHIHNMFDGERKGIPILSVVGQLNDPFNDYEGGEFVMFKDDVMDLRQGDIMIFPSVFLYPHRVNAVKKGTRYSFISWVW
jgi:predicted 2-oxoglutarate/Fe(II)-dependent dioxygenase YbiX